MRHVDGMPIARGLFSTDSSAWAHDVRKAGASAPQ